jgi:transglutaminase-like putative cysteine protease
MSDVHREMKRMSEEGAADLELQEIARNAVRENPIKDIYDWVKNNIKYTSDPYDIELFVHPSRLIREYKEGKNPQEDCDGISILTYAMLKAVGIKARIVLLDTKGDEIDHATAQAWSENLQEWIFVDPSTSVYPFGWEEKYIRMEVI